MGKGHSDLRCTICGTDIEVPMCCEGEMAVQGDALVCHLCESKKEVPICCGKKMKVVL